MVTVLEWGAERHMHLLSQLAGLGLDNVPRQALRTGLDGVGRTLAPLLQLLCQLVSHWHRLQYGAPQGLDRGS
jgi:hypothetical protein